ncbi:membrane protein [Beggiatoa sp. PS]|nr:membrane protein [Beggiatoa sp. PS]
MVVAFLWDHHIVPKLLKLIMYFDSRLGPYVRRAVHSLNIMYPLFMITLAILTVLRTLGRSMGDTTWLVIGAVSGVALMIAFFLRPVLDKEPK